MSLYNILTVFAVFPLNFADLFVFVNRYRGNLIVCFTAAVPRYTYRYSCVELESYITRLFIQAPPEPHAAPRQPAYASTQTVLHLTLRAMLPTCTSD